MTFKMKIVYEKKIYDTSGGLQFKPFKDESGDLIYSRFIRTEIFPNTLIFKFMEKVHLNISKKNRKDYFKIVNLDREIYSISFMDNQISEILPYNFLEHISKGNIAGEAAESILDRLFHDLMFIKNREILQEYFPEWTEAMENLIYGYEGQRLAEA